MIYKCKSCGGDLMIQNGETVAECEFCGVRQALPRLNDDVLQNLFNRANALRLKCEFDKAEQLYEKILQESDGDAEPYWGIVLCKYGIEYVEDPKTYKRVPTCHRTSYDAVITDPDYLAAIERADDAQKEIYEAEAKVIDEIQKNILSIVKNEKPFDVFLCYKEADADGKRTQDSAIANDIYHQLTQEGLKVFYAAITLEDKLGCAYEPYIFAALNSAKVMLVIGTKPEYFTAVWVKNEWSRFLKLMKSDRSKLLIPCYKNMDAYELPEEFAHLQAQDMGKIGFINDVVRGIKKVTTKEETTVMQPRENATEQATPAVALLLKRAFLFLECGEWRSAAEYCEKALDLDPENAEGYLVKLMACSQVKEIEQLRLLEQPFDGGTLYKMIIRFGDEDLCRRLQGYNREIRDRREAARIAQAKRQEAARIAQMKRDAEAARIAREMMEREAAAIKAKENQRKLHNGILLVGWVLLVSICILTASIYSGARNVEDGFWSSFFAGGVLVLAFSAITLMLTFVALLLAAVKNNDPVGIVKVARVFSIIGFAVMVLGGAASANEAEMTFISVLMFLAAATNAICFAVPFFRKK